MIYVSPNLFDRQRRKSSVDDGVDMEMEGLQAGLEKLAMKPKVGWCEVHTYVVYCPTQLAISLLMLF